MSDYLTNDSTNAPNLDCPDALIRLASVVHRFSVPKIASSKKTRFSKAFATVGRGEKARVLMLKADDERERFQDANNSPSTISSERIISQAKRYTPLINAVLLSCKIQPEAARLDEKLVFEWKSGVEVNVTSGGKKDANSSSSTVYKSEAIMYDLCMSVASEGLGQALAATEHSVKGGDFVSASKAYAISASIFDFLANNQLPKWISKGSNVDDATLPSECHAPFCQALTTLFMANRQQMAVATLLVKQDSKPNYSLLAKLTLGIHELLEDFISLLRREAFNQQGRMDKDFFTLVTLQIAVQNALSLYFQARANWVDSKFGLAIALLSEATVALRNRESDASPGVPDVSRSTALSPLKNELHDLRAHMNVLLQAWEKDNNSVYFESVPQHVPASYKLKQGLQMKNNEVYDLEQVEPVLLVVPGGTSGPSMQRTDSDLARELQDRLNAGDDF